MATENSQHVAVIGAGIIGICSALQLQNAGFRVTLIDEQGIAQGCSKGNAGHFATEQVFPLANASLLKKLPKMLFDPLGPLRIDWRYALKAFPWFWRFLLNMRKQKFAAHTHALRALNESALPAYDRLLTRFKLQHLITKQGSLLTFEHTSIEEINKHHQQFLAQGVKVKLLNQSELHQVEPSLSNNVQYALLFEEVAHTVDPYLFCTSLMAQFRQLGGTFTQAKVSKLVANLTEFSLKVGSQEQAFDKVVIAAGAWSTALLKPLGYHAPLDTERGYHCMVNFEHGLTRPVASYERSFIMTPMTEGLRLAGTVEFAGVDKAMNEARALSLLPHASKLLNTSSSLHAQSTWMGCRPSLPDSLPILGRAPHHPNLIFAFGHQHLGLTQAAITAELVSELCQGFIPALNLKPYCISRFN